MEEFPGSRIVYQIYKNNIFYEITFPYKGELAGGDTFIFRFGYKKFGERDFKTG